MIALIVVDVLMTGFCIKKRQQFYGCVTFIAYTLHYVSFLTLDSLLLTYYHFGGMLGDAVVWKLRTGIKVQMLALLSITIFKIVLSLLRSIKELIEEFRPSVIPE